MVSSSQIVATAAALLSIFLNIGSINVMMLLMLIVVRDTLQGTTFLHPQDGPSRKVRVQNVGLVKIFPHDGDDGAM